MAEAKRKAGVVVAWVVGGLALAGASVGAVLLYRRQKKAKPEAGVDAAKEAADKAEAARRAEEAKAAADKAKATAAKARADQGKGADQVKGALDWVAKNGAGLIKDGQAIFSMFSSHGSASA